MTHGTKKAIDVIVPTVIAGGLGWFLFFKTKKVEYVIAGAAIAWILGYAIVSQLTKVAATNGPAPVPTGGGCDDFDPTTLVDALHEDIHCFACLRKRELYDQLLGLADCQLIKAYNYWNTKYYNQGKESLPVAIAGESASFDSRFGQQQQALSKRFLTLSLS